MIILSESLKLYLNKNATITESILIRGNNV